MEPFDIEAFATAQLKLLDAELKAELAETNSVATQSSPAALQRAGLAILNLHVSAERTGLGGRNVAELELDPAVGRTELPEHGLRVGDIVGIREQLGGAAKKRKKAEAEKEGLDGVVVKVTSNTLHIALDKEAAEMPSSKIWILKLANDVTYKRMSQTMHALQTHTPTPFTSVLFGLTSPTPPPSTPPPEKYFTSSLNDSQKAAIHFALSAPEIALIHGPPGTGKTHTLIELILQILALSPSHKILVCGPSNISVDNIVERLAPHKIPMVRLGHPARLLPSVTAHALDVLTKTSDAGALVADIRAEIDAKVASIRKTRSGRERRAIYAELKDLRKDYRERERACVDTLVRNARVVLATLHGAGGHQLKAVPQGFDVVIIDEASQALEAQCWVPLLSAKKAVLAGDHMQLPPTIKSSSHPPKNPSSSSKKPSSITLEETLFTRLLSLHGPSIKHMLTTQYRMHASIMTYPSLSLYSSLLKADKSCASHTLADLPGVSRNDITTAPLIFYDTQGGDFPETLSDSLSSSSKLLADSKSNPHEALLIGSHISQLISSGILPTQIAVITPYNAQLSLLADSLKPRYPGLELGSVDGFQGREKEVVLLSLVRSNAEKEIGFLADRRRINVAATRARRQLVVVADGETVGALRGGEGGGREGKQAGKGEKKKGAKNAKGEEKGAKATKKNEKKKGEQDKQSTEEEPEKKEDEEAEEEDPELLGRTFLHGWIEFLEAEADVIYPDLAQVSQTEAATSLEQLEIR